MSNLNVEIISVGNELCLGRVQDTNSFWLADKVTRIGGTVTRITCVRDDEEEICKVLEESLARRPRFILMTGGLGPTRDDKTIEAISRLTKKQTVIDEATITKTSERKGIPKGKLPPHYKRMARTISGAEAYLNPVGVSPTTVLEMERTTIVAMPGPPREVQAIFEAYISGMIAAESKHRSYSRRIVVDMVESEAEPLINQVMSEIADIYMKPLISQYTENGLLPVEIVAFGEDEDSCRITVEEAIRLLKGLASTKGGRVEEQETPPKIRGEIDDHQHRGA
ncbi:hypothetical protein KEJ23_04740 [Candidatus Bathyarchaeota archaeon]|nr:hypothetical protein [Candidatus Bathyarchaeota archaeon]